jgi:hypothetical protein
MKVYCATGREVGGGGPTLQPVVLISIGGIQSRKVETIVLKCVVTKSQNPEYRGSRTSRVLITKHASGSCIVKCHYECHTRNLRIRHIAVTRITVFSNAQGAILR